MMEHLQAELDAVRPDARPNKTYLIWSNEHEAWWAKHEMGYVNARNLAGVYPEERALDICIKAGYLRPGLRAEVMVPAP